MAIWQWDFYLAPEGDLYRHFSGFPEVLTGPQFDALTLWQQTELPPEAIERLARVVPEFRSWEPSLRWFGTEFGNRVDLWWDGPRLRTVLMKLDLRSVDFRFLNECIDLARSTSSLLWCARTGRLVQPQRTDVLELVLGSISAHELWDELSSDAGVPGPDRFMQGRSVFISYASSDRTFAARLASDLHERGADVWFDQWALQVGDSIVERVEAGISSAAYLIVVLSPHSVDSRWVQRELSAAFVRELEDRQVILLPALIADCKIPVLIRDRLYADFREEYSVGLDALFRRLKGDVTRT